MQYNEKIAVVMLNFMTLKEPVVFLKSIRNLFPFINVLVVDNGSPSAIKQQLKAEVDKYENTKLFLLEKNIGFARGLNYGINQARNMGFDFVVASNSDITFPDNLLFQKLLSTYNETKCAVIGPAILTPRNINQNPFLEYRPTNEEALHIFKASTKIGIVRQYLFSKIIKYCNESLTTILRNYYRSITKRSHLAPKKETNVVKYQIRNVYSLHGAFLMFCPPFFNHYHGFCEKTFLYGEELILAEMLFSKKLKAVYDSTGTIFHHEDATSTLLWGGEDKIKPLLFSAQSIKIWYELFQKNNYMQKTRYMGGNSS
jgi:GT2 family glycosyltransferase